MIGLKYNVDRVIFVDLSGGTLFFWKNTGEVDYYMLADIVSWVYFARMALGHGS